MNNVEIIMKPVVDSDDIFNVYINIYYMDMLYTFSLFMPTDGSHTILKLDKHIFHNKITYVSISYIDGYNINNPYRLSLSIDNHVITANIENTKTGDVVMKFPEDISNELTNKLLEFIKYYKENICNG